MLVPPFRACPRRRPAACPRDLEPFLDPADKLGCDYNCMQRSEIQGAK
jgi:hypothetical protein